MGKEWVKMWAGKGWAGKGWMKEWARGGFICVSVMYKKKVGRGKYRKASLVK